MLLNAIWCSRREAEQNINARCTLDEIILLNVEKLKYIGVTITEDLRWNTDISNICTKANRNIERGFLGRKVYSCPQDVKKAAYKGLVLPVLVEHFNYVWDPQAVGLQDGDELEIVQKCAAKFVTGINNYESVSMTIKMGISQEKMGRQRFHLSV